MKEKFCRSGSWHFYISFLLLGKCCSLQTINFELVLLYLHLCVWLLTMYRRADRIFCNFILKILAVSAQTLHQHNITCKDIRLIFVNTLVKCQFNVTRDTTMCWNGMIGMSNATRLSISPIWIFHNCENCKHSRGISPHNFKTKSDLKFAAFLFFVCKF